DRASEREKLQIAGTYYEDVTGEWRNAVDALEELVQSYPRLQEGMEANPYAMLGGLYEMHGMYVEAVDETRQAIQIVPDHLPCGTQKCRQPPNAVQKTRFLPREFLFLAAALFLIPIP